MTDPTSYFLPGAAKGVNSGLVPSPEFSQFFPPSGGMIDDYLRPLFKRQTCSKENCIQSCTHLLPLFDSTREYRTKHEVPLIFILLCFTDQTVFSPFF